MRFVKPLKYGFRRSILIGAENFAAFWLVSRIQNFLYQRQLPFLVLFRGAFIGAACNTQVITCKLSKKVNGGSVQPPEAAYKPSKSAWGFQAITFEKGLAWHCIGLHAIMSILHAKPPERGLHGGCAEPPLKRGLHKGCMQNSEKVLGVCMQPSGVAQKPSERCLWAVHNPSKKGIACKPF